MFLADTVYVMSNRPGRFMVKREIDLPRPHDLELTYSPTFTDIVHELRGHIGAVRNEFGNQLGNQLGNPAGNQFGNPAGKAAADLSRMYEFFSLLERRITGWAHRGSQNP